VLPSFYRGYTCLKFFATQPEIVETGDNVTFLWMVENIDTQSNGWWMEAADEKLFVPTNGLTVYNGQTGSLLWHNDSEPDQFEVTKNAVYITVGNLSINPHIEALDIQSGARLWYVGTSVKIKSIANLRVHDDLVYIQPLRHSYGRLYSADTGDFLFEENTTLSEKEIEELAPSYNPDYFLWPPKTTDIWQFDELVSNEAISEKVVFGLTGNDRLEGRDMESGDVIYSVQFSPEKMHRVNWKGMSYRHKVAVDTANNLVYVWFVDSLQLFAFEFSSE